MMQKYWYFLLLAITILSLNTSNGQSVYYSGNLLRISFSSKQVDQNDTLGSWYHKSYDSMNVHSFSYKKYFDHFSTAQRSYFLTKAENYGFNQYPYIEYRIGRQYLENEENLFSREFSTLPSQGWDIPEPYMINRTIVTQTKNGYWLNNGAFGNSFLANNDSLFYYILYSPSDTTLKMPDLLRAVLGKINDKYLAAFTGKPDKRSYELYMFNPDQSPLIDTFNSVRISITGDSTLNYDSRITFNQNSVSQIRNLSGDLFAVTTNNGAGISIYRFTGTSLIFIKSILKDELKYGTRFIPGWEIRHNKLLSLSKSPSGPDLSSRIHYFSYLLVFSHCQF